jgi:hypothetical protein
VGESLVTLVTVELVRDVTLGVSAELVLASEAGIAHGAQAAGGRLAVGLVLSQAARLPEFPPTFAAGPGNGAPPVNQQVVCQ